MLNTHNQGSHARHQVGLTLTLIGLMSGVPFMPRPGRLAFAQSVAASWSYTGSLNRFRLGHTATLLPSGKVLVAGGFNSITNSAEMYDPAAGAWSYTGNLNAARINHTATLLQNGKVLVVGGVNQDQFSRPPNSTELYDPSTGTWSYTGSLNTARESHTATLLPSGKVLVAGGSGSNGILNRAELYDPGTGTWSSTGNLNAARVGHTATLLPNGKVLVAGSQDDSCSLDDCPSLNSAELYDPSTGVWSYTGDLNTGRYLQTATLLPSGKVLVAGGVNFNSLNSTEVYDPAAGTWSIAGNLSTEREGHTATLLPNGNVLIAGGFNFINSLPNAAELYDPATGMWSITATLNSGRYYHTASLLLNGKVLVASGFDGVDFLYTAELYDPGGSTPNQIDDPQFFVRQHYLDFLNRNADASGLAFWTNEITLCGTDAGCIEVKRINVSAAFFISIEFQETGYLVYRIYKSSYGDIAGTPVPVRLNEFHPDTQQIGQGVIVNQAGWDQVLENNKQVFTAEFVQRPRFTSAFPTLMTPALFVDALFANAGVTPSASDRAAAINEFGSATDTSNVAARARVLRDVAENFTLKQQDFNRAFVLMQYFGYLRRNPNDPPEPTLDFTGYNFWLNKLNQFNGNFINAEMVKAFITSTEYRQRFGQP